ncbi:MAG: OB-fold domain-containing protein [Deltaproteobacteria bacterium]|nr:OB-fold domain-containing protein [Deltaproteobacteria bacterium]
MSEKETQATPTPPSRVVPLEDQPFWDAIDNDSFVLARCTCGSYYARLQACLRCGADARALTWVPASGRGTVRTFIVFDKPYHPYFKERLPYIVAVIALEEGPELTTNIIDTDVTNVEIGMPVRIVIGTRGEHKIHQASARV